MREGRGFIPIAVTPLKPLRLPAGSWRGYIKHSVWVLWTNTYLGLSDFVIYNYEINFNFKEFRTLLRFVDSTLKLVLVKAYYFISKVKRYHYPLRCAYEIVIAKQLELFNAN